MISHQEIAEICEKNGLKLVGCSDAAPLNQELTRLKSWQSNGYAGEMAYMNRDAEMFIDPSRFLDGAKSVISVAVQYENKPHPPLAKGCGRIARYAWGTDYHEVLRRSLERLQGALSKYGNTRAFTDAVPMLERAFAEKGKLGFIGKNSLLIKPGVGSYFFIAEVITDFSILKDSALKEYPGCRTCSRCIDRCPTGAIVEERVVDARKCISYLTIEKKGIFTDEERSMVGEWLFGCDICQDVCPFNHGALKREKGPDMKDFTASHGVGSLLSLSEVLSIPDDATFKVRFKGSPILRTKRSGLIRNACAVAINTGTAEVRPLLEKLLRDDNEVVRLSAQSALEKI